MADVERTITVEGDQQKVWDYLSDFRTSEEWDPPTQTTERTSGDGGVGTTYRNVSKFLGMETEVTYEVAAFEAPHRLVLRGDGGSVQLLDTITVEQVGPQVQVTYHAEFEPVGMAKLAEPLLPLGLKKLADEVAESLEEHLRRVA